MIDYNELVNSQAKEFKLKDGVYLPSFKFYSHESDTQKKKELEGHQSKIQQEKIAE
jgi:hypothetical protein